MHLVSDIVLFVFEGAKTEPQLLDNLKKHYFAGCQNTVIKATFDTHIYTLWDIVKKDRFLDLLEIIRERNNENRKVLEGISREDVSQIFLFFDYDGHAKEASDEAIQEMLDYFGDETDAGKLYISYPMVEAVKHLKVGIDFKHTIVDAKNKIKCENTRHNYKQLVDRSTSYQNLTALTSKDWDYVILENIKKANLIVNNLYEQPEYNKILSEMNQAKIFAHQLQKYINNQNTVAVLSAFPFFIIEYFGEKVIK